MKIGKHWETIRKVFEEAYKSCLHFAVATVNEDGSPHVTPIGALFLRDDQTGYYFDENPVRTSRNLAIDPRICILAVNADMSLWGEALMAGRFTSPPAVRLSGIAGEFRKATDEEIARWREKTAGAKGSKGYALLWDHFSRVRDIAFDSFEPVNLGEMTRCVWGDHSPQ